jgi:hypothetical protein
VTAAWQSDFHVNFAVGQSWMAITIVDQLRAFLGTAPYLAFAADARKSQAVVQL